MKAKTILSLCIILFAACLSSCSTLSGSGTGIATARSLPGSYQQIALLLPLQGPLGGAGRAIRNGFLAGFYQDQNNTNAKPRIRIYDTSKTNNIRSLYRTAVNNGAGIVIGPLNKTNVAKLANSSNISVPTITLNYLNSNVEPPRLLFQFGISPQNQALLVADKAYSDGHRNVIIIAPSGAWGQSVVNTFTNAWDQEGGKVVDQLYYQPRQNLRSAIKNLMQVNLSETRAANLERTIGKKINYVPQRRQDADMIFLVAMPQVARQIMPLLRFYYAGNLPTYSISLIYAGIPRPTYYRDMNGVIFCDIPWIFDKNSRAMQSKIKKLWPGPYQNYFRLYALGLDAYMLTQDFNKISTSASFGLPGKTGRLYLASGQRILQTLKWVQIRNGWARLI